MQENIKRPPDEIMAISIYELPLGWRARRALRLEFGRDASVGRIVNSRWIEIARLPDVGVKTIENIRRSLVAVGHYYRESTAVSELRIDDALIKTWENFGWIEGPNAKRPERGT